MRPGQQKQRSRGRNNNGGGGNNNNNNNRKGQNPLTRTYDSSGPDVKIRGTAQHIAEKYMALARDASSSGDRVMAENYLQHAEHYNRIIAAAQAMFQERFQRDDRQEYSERQDYSERDDDDNDNDGNDNSGQSEQSSVPEYAPQPVIDASTPQPVIEGTPAEVQIEEEVSNQENSGDRGQPAQRRRSPARPRRTPRRSAAEKEGTEGSEERRPKIEEVPAE